MTDKVFPSRKYIRDRYGNELLRFCQSRLGSSNGEDVFQQVWLKVLKNPDQFTGGNQRAWLFQIARTTIIDFVRKKKPQTGNEALLASADSADRTNHKTILDDLVASEDYETFKRCLRKLPPEKRNLVQLRVTGYSYQQISDKLAIEV